MKFSEEVKQLRKKYNYTQAQFAEKLHVTRQAVSNWENEKNLPDIETVIEIAQVFHISLDELILGGNDQMSEKLINDGKENKKAKFNMIATLIGAGIIVLGFLCFVIKGFSVEYVDAQGILHENFFLIIIGYGLLFIGMIILLINGIITLKNYLKNR
jgi:transcriptional regulator with XRE-family HTH domain